MKEGSQQFTMTGQIGTPIYMAPEILTGSKNRYGKGADVYSYGILLWAMFNRDIPYKLLILQGNLDAFALAQRVAKGLRPNVCVEQEKPLPAPYESLVQACWHQDPASRPSFREILTRLN